jgi:peroxiredoxin
VALACAAASPSRPAAAAGDPLAELRAAAPNVTLRKVGGGKLELAELRARGPVLLDFWATWCKPCAASLPELEALHRRFADRGLTVVGVSIDGPRNYPKVRPFASRLGLTYPIVLDGDGGLQRAFHVLAVPTSILIGRDGAILAVHQGYRPGESAALAVEVERALGVAADSSSADSSGSGEAPR